MIAAGVPNGANAWFEDGHRLVATLAWRQMPEDVRRRTTEILRSHPRFAEDFAPKPPAVLRSDADTRGDYLLQVAAVWPDIARDLEPADRLRYDRPRWHYIEWPLFTDADSMGILNSRIPPVPFDDPGGVDHALLNAVQATKNSRAVLSDAEASDELKAVHLCWVAHLVGDLHQPCHAASLYSKSMYRTGNKGGNWTPVEPGETLHLFWDGVLGNQRGFGGDEDLARVRSKAESIVPADADAASTAARRELRPTRWAAESHELAREVVYTPELVGYLLKMEAEKVRSLDLPPFALSEDYQSAARKVAERRVVEAAARLAEVLTVDLRPAAK